LWPGNGEKADVSQEIPEIVHSDVNDVTGWPEPPRPLDYSNNDTENGDVMCSVSSSSSAAG